MDSNNEVVYLYLDDIIPNRFQPREVFDDQALKELAVSIKEHGVIQPIIVRKVENKYEIIAGERRYKASTMAGLTKIPAIVKNLDDKESSKVALIENLQRRDLTPIEEARTYQKILELESNMTQEQLAQTMGKTQSVVSNKLRLLALPDEVQDALLKEKISERHARSLLNIENKNDQIKMLDRIIAERMTVRELDKEIKSMNDNQNNSMNLFGSMGINPAPVSITEPTVEAPAVATPSVGPTISINNDSNNNANVNTNTNSSVSVDNIFNPTAVDINKIRENAVDIVAPSAPTVDVKDLMKDNSDNSPKDFKFVPSFGSNTEQEKTVNNPAPSFGSFGLFGASNNNSSSVNSLNSDNSVASVPVTPPVAPNFGFFGNTSVTPTVNDESSNNNVASTIAAPKFSINAFGGSSKKDVTPAVTDIKSAITGLESKGYKVVFEELDSNDTYQMTIKIDKNV
ncbi:MAG: ParB/RepB/Spo0J family partition protein [Bacilli bacterium]|nr:ParB/RepB/Spo0J family partition protein [Bacilli bacterium]